MRNLAGVVDADTYIRGELDEAGVERVVHPEPVDRSEVPMRVTGRLGSFTFRRLWYYYAVHGRVPLAVARELYEHPIGKRDVRVAGHCGCPPPSEWATHVDAEGFEVVEDPDGSEEREARDFLAAHPDIGQVRLPRYVRSLSDARVESFVDNYHIDSQEGLNLFVETLRRHGLASQEPAR
jgi:hypothetical protein